MNTQAQTQGWRKYFNKDLVPFLITAALAGASVYLIGPWIDNIMLLETATMIYNFAAAIAAGITFFVAKTHYDRGGWNVFWKIIGVTGLATLTVGFILLASMHTSILYPLAGVFIVIVTFYMVSLSSVTMGLGGIIGAVIVFGAGIAYGLLHGIILQATAIILAKLLVLGILVLGGVAAKFKMYLHGIQGVSNNGGFGDINDGNGDTGNEG